MDGRVGRSSEPEDQLGNQSVIYKQNENESIISTLGANVSFDPSEHLLNMERSIQNYDNLDPHQDWLKKTAELHDPDGGNPFRRENPKGWSGPYSGSPSPYFSNEEMTLFSKNINTYPLSPSQNQHHNENNWTTEESSIENKTQSEKVEKEKVWDRTSSPRPPSFRKSVRSSGNNSYYSVTSRSIDLEFDSDIQSNSKPNSKRSSMRTSVNSWTLKSDTDPLKRYSSYSNDNSLIMNSMGDMNYVNYEPVNESELEQTPPNLTLGGTTLLTKTLAPTSFQGQFPEEMNKPQIASKLFSKIENNPPTTEKTVGEVEVGDRNYSSQLSDHNLKHTLLDTYIVEGFTELNLKDGFNTPIIPGRQHSTNTQEYTSKNQLEDEETDDQLTDVDFLNHKDLVGTVSRKLQDISPSQIHNNYLQDPPSDSGGTNNNDKNGRKSSIPSQNEQFQVTSLNAVKEEENSTQSSSTPSSFPSSRKTSSHSSSADSLLIRQQQGDSKLTILVSHVTYSNYFKTHYLNADEEGMKRSKLKTDIGEDHKNGSLNADLKNENFIVNESNSIASSSAIEADLQYKKEVNLHLLIQAFEPWEQMRTIDELIQLHEVLEKNDFIVKDNTVLPSLPDFNLKTCMNQENIRIQAETYIQALAELSVIWNQTPFIDFLEGQTNCGKITRSLHVQRLLQNLDLLANKNSQLHRKISSSKKKINLSLEILKEGKLLPASGSKRNNKNEDTESENPSSLEGLGLQSTGSRIVNQRSKTSKTPDSSRSSSLSYPSEVSVGISGTSRRSSNILEDVQNSNSTNSQFTSGSSNFSVPSTSNKALHEEVSKDNQKHGKPLNKKRIMSKVRNLLETSLVVLQQEESLKEHFGMSAFSSDVEFGDTEYEVSEIELQQNIPRHLKSTTLDRNSLLINEAINNDSFPKIRDPYLNLLYHNEMSKIEQGMNLLTNYCIPSNTDYIEFEKILAFFDSMIGKEIGVKSLIVGAAKSKIALKHDTLEFCVFAPIKQKDKIFLSLTENLCQSLSDKSTIAKKDASHSINLEVEKDVNPGLASDTCNDFGQENSPVDSGKIMKDVIPSQEIHVEKSKEQQDSGDICTSTSSLNVSWFTISSDKRRKVIDCQINKRKVVLSFNEVDSILLPALVEEFDLFVGKDHLVKNSILLIKSWAYYGTVPSKKASWTTFLDNQERQEASQTEINSILKRHKKTSLYDILGHDALVVMILSIINCHYNEIERPFQVFILFLYKFAYFDWKRNAVSINGKQRIRSVSYRQSESRGKVESKYEKKEPLSTIQSDTTRQYIQHNEISEINTNVNMTKEDSSYLFSPEYLQNFIHNLLERNEIHNALIERESKESTKSLTGNKSRIRQNISLDNKMNEVEVQDITSISSSRLKHDASSDIAIALAKEGQKETNLSKEQVVLEKDESIESGSGLIQTEKRDNALAKDFVSIPRKYFSPKRPILDTVNDDSDYSDDDDDESDEDDEKHNYYPMTILSPLFSEDNVAFSISQKKLEKVKSMLKDGYKSLVKSSRTFMKLPSTDATSSNEVKDDKYNNHPLSKMKFLFKERWPYIKLHLIKNRSNRKIDTSETVMKDFEIVVNKLDLSLYEDEKVKLYNDIRSIFLILCRHVSESALRALSMEILAVSAPLPIGEIGKYLKEATNFASISIKLKHSYGGLKRFFETYPEQFLLASNHPYNPMVYSRQHLTQSDIDMVNQNDGRLPGQNQKKTKREKKERVKPFQDKQHSEIQTLRPLSNENTVEHEEAPLENISHSDDSINLSQSGMSRSSSLQPPGLDPFLSNRPMLSAHSDNIQYMKSSALNQGNQSEELRQSDTFQHQMLPTRDPRRGDPNKLPISVQNNEFNFNHYQNQHRIDSGRMDRNSIYNMTIRLDEGQPTSHSTRQYNARRESELTAREKMMLGQAFSDDVPSVISNGTNQFQRQQPHSIPLSLNSIVSWNESDNDKKRRELNNSRMHHQQQQEEQQQQYQYQHQNQQQQQQYRQHHQQKHQKYHYQKQQQQQQQKQHQNEQQQLQLEQIKQEIYQRVQKQMEEQVTQQFQQVQRQFQLEQETGNYRQFPPLQQNQQQQQQQGGLFYHNFPENRPGQYSNRSYQRGTNEHGGHHLNFQSDSFRETGNNKRYPK